MRKLLILRDPQMLARELNTKSSGKAHPASLTVSAGSVVSEAPAMKTAVAASPSATILEEVTKVKLQAETDAILGALNSTRWNRKRAATLLNIDYKALLYKMKKLGIDDTPAPFAPAFGAQGQAMAACGD